jgi:hypothetical protein
VYGTYRRENEWRSNTEIIAAHESEDWVDRTEMVIKGKIEVRT